MISVGIKIDKPAEEEKQRHRSRITATNPIVTAAAAAGSQAENGECRGKTKPAESFKVTS